MDTTRRNLSGIALSLVFAACGAPPSAPDSSAPRDAGVNVEDSGPTPEELNIVGAWTAPFPFDRAVDMRQAARFAFTGTAQSGTVAFSLRWTYAEGDMLAGCNATVRTMGDYSVSGNRVGITFTAGTVAASGCAEPSRNAPDTAMTSEQLESYNVSGDASMSDSNSLRIGRLSMTRE